MADDAITRLEEHLDIDVREEQVGRARVRKEVDLQSLTKRVDRLVEQADTERVPVADPAADSGEVETLEDGSLSIPALEEELVVTKRWVVRERVIVRKTTVTEQHEITADLRRERIAIDADEGVVVHDDGGR